MLDACYGSFAGLHPNAGAVSGTVSTLSNSGDNLSRLRREGDEPAIAQHSHIMRTLKRQRRPQFDDDEEDIRRRKRMRGMIARAEVTVTSLDNNRPESGAGASSVVTGDPVENSIEQVVSEMGLSTNPEQERAFRIVADHVRMGSEQLLMYIAGVGGTGKTHVIKSILRLFDLLGRGREILVGAPTGAAALNVDGFTVHSLTMLPGKSKRTLQELRKLWKHVKYFVIDEISMIGARFLADISKRLQQAKSDEGSVAVEPFGGINIIFTGDFGQLKPVHASALYSHKLINRPGLQTIRNHMGVDNLRGIYLWRQVGTVVKLTKNQRQVSDPAYAALLDRVRIGEGRSHCTESGEQSDVNVLYGRVMSKVVMEDPTVLQRFGDAPIIVGTKALRDGLNSLIIAYKAKEVNEQIITYHARDRIDGKPVERHARAELWVLPTKITEDSLGQLPLFRRMKVMVRENIAFGRRLVNGAEGTIRNVLYELRDGVPCATVAYVHIPGAGRISADLEEDVVPVFPEKVYFKYAPIINGKKVLKSVTREQLPLVPAYAYTDYKSQGKSLTHAIMDLESACSLQGVYVMLSRVRSMEGLLIMRPFSHAKICTRLSQELRDELRRIDMLDEMTRVRYASLN